MTTTLPADLETAQLANELAKATGKPLPTIVREAITAKAEEAGITKRSHHSGEELVARMMAITDRFAALPVLDPRSPEEISGYDAFGLPR